MTRFVRAGHLGIWEGACRCRLSAVSTPVALGFLHTVLRGFLEDSLHRSSVQEKLTRKGLVQPCANRAITNLFALLMFFAVGLRGMQECLNLYSACVFCPTGRSTAPKNIL